MCYDFEQSVSKIAFRRHKDALRRAVLDVPERESSGE
jgi:hypothetical protein